MFEKILIANRGEIAVRIIRACNEMSIRTVAIYMIGEEQELHVQLADEAICMGPPNVSKTYLDMTNILNVAITTGADAIHPGVGFLSENSEFAKRCAECDIAFIGPSVDVLDRMGNKEKARKVAKDVNVPVVSGSEKPITTLADAISHIQHMHYPIIIKAVHGGGGKGMRRVESAEAFENAYHAAQLEAKQAFGNADVYIEEFIPNAWHIEVQVLADMAGHIIYLGERDCSIQRNNQKLIEEAPASCLSAELRERIHEAAVRLTRHLQYVGVGTIEFLIDHKGHYYFMEMNTRLQVEHTVTEMITGIDLVKEQILVASGQTLQLQQSDIVFHGHAIECRINAEDPEENFAPCPGTVDFIHFPGGSGVRIDTNAFVGSKVSPFFDSLLAKIIVHGNSREEALAKMRRALEECVVEPIKTNISFQYEIINHPIFRKGNIHTNFITDNAATLLKRRGM